MYSSVLASACACLCVLQKEKKKKTNQILLSSNNQYEVEREKND